MRSSPPRLSSVKRERRDILAFRNDSGSQCWLNSSLQLVIHSLRMQNEVHITSKLGELIRRLMGVGTIPVAPEQIYIKNCFIFV